MCTELLLFRMDIFDDPASEMIVAHVEIPGMRKEDVTLQVHEGTLIVAGERRPAVGAEWLSTSTTNVASHGATQGSAPPNDQAAPAPTTNKFRVQELKYGKFKRVIGVPAGLDVCRRLY
jgi:HSP20 family protein